MLYLDNMLLRFVETHARGRLAEVTSSTPSSVPVDASWPELGGAEGAACNVILYTMEDNLVAVSRPRLEVCS